MPSPLVSAIIPAYNRPDRTQRAIKSVAEQTYTPIELLVVDDGSTPPLADSLDLPEGRLESVELIRLNENQGANVARNTGIDAATGDYLAFLDSDDEWMPEKIERQVAVLQRSNAQAAFTSVKQLDSDGNLNSVRRATCSGNLRGELLTGNEIGTFSSFMITGEAVRDVGKPDPALPCWQDWEWFLRLSESIRFVGLEEPLVRRHNEGGQISGAFSPKRDRAYPVLRERITDVAQTDGEETAARAALDFHLGYSALVNEEFSTARRLFARSILNNPTDWDSFKYLAVSGGHYQVARRVKRGLVQAVLS